MKKHILPNALTLLALAFTGSPDTSSARQTNSNANATLSTQPASTNHFREVLTIPVTNAADAQDSLLQAEFDRFHGFDRDPVIQTFRDNGQTAVGFLARKLESKDASIRLKAVTALRQMKPPFTASEAGIAALCVDLDDPDVNCCSIAEGALGDLGPKAKAAVPALIRIVSARTDINGVWALGRIGPDAKAALPVLESKMRQATGRERVYAAGAVWKIGGANADASAVVKKALEDPDQHVRIDAKNVLVESPEINSQ